MKVKKSVVIMGLAIVFGGILLCEISDKKVRDYVDSTWTNESKERDVGEKVPSIVNDKEYTFYKEENQGGSRYIYENTNFSKSGVKNIEMDVLDKLEKVKCGVTTISELIGFCGKPTKVIVAKYNGSAHLNYFYGEISFYIGINWDTVKEIRIENGNTSFAYRDKIKIGSKMSEVLETIGVPKIILEGKANRFEKNTLYKDIGGQKGVGYVDYEKEKVRIFFMENKVMGIYLY